MKIIATITYLGEKIKIYQADIQNDMKHNLTLIIPKKWLKGIKIELKNDKMSNIVDMCHQSHFLNTSILIVNAICFL